MLSKLLLFCGTLAHLCPYLSFNLMQLNLMNIFPPFSSKCPAIRWKQEGISTIIVLENSPSRETDKTIQNKTKQKAMWILSTIFDSISRTLWITVCLLNVTDSYVETLTPSASQHDCIWDLVIRLLKRWLIQIDVARKDLNPIWLGPW